MVSSLVTMTEIARIAGVTRQAVTNWRRRSGSAPFPLAVDSLGGAERFDLRDILDWIDATGRGRNVDARLDAPSIAVPGDLDLDNAVALLALRGGVSEDLAPLSPQERIALAEEMDPDDRYLLAEVRELAADDDLAAYVDELLAAAFGPSDALDRLYASRAAQGSRGLTPALIDLLQELAEVCRTHLGPDDVAIELRLDPRDRRVGVSFPAADSGADRSMLRHQALDGVSPPARRLPLSGWSRSWGSLTRTCLIARTRLRWSSVRARSRSCLGRRRRCATPKDRQGRSTKAGRRHSKASVLSR